MLIDTIIALDENIAQWLHAHTVPWLTDSMEVVSLLHDTMAMTIMTLVIAAILIAKRDWYWLLNLILAVPGGMLINLLMKHVFQRARPTFEAPLVNLSSYGFPSGHTATSTLVYGVLAILIISRTRSRNCHIWTVLLATAMVSVVAFSRLYLGVHYLSDVLVAVVEGVIWLALCLKITGAYMATRRH